MELEVDGKIIKTDEQGYLCNLDDWSEELAEKLAELDGIQLFDDHWGLIMYFRDYYQQTSRIPSMRTIVLDLGKQHGKHFHDEKIYGKYLYKLFPNDPVRALCKLAGLPRPEPDT
jgi:tRNA 2-thiouridine synthesizing protein E